MCDEGAPLSGNTMVVSGNTKDTGGYPVQGVVEPHAGFTSNADKPVEITDGTSNYLEGSPVNQEKQEMAFTVVAVDTDVSGHVQLSIIPTGTRDVSKLSTNAVELSATDNPGLFNQLAFIATNMESSNAPCATDQQQPPVTDNPIAIQPTVDNQLDELTPEVLTQPVSLSRAQKRGQREEQGEKVKNAKKGRVRCSECAQDFSDLPSMRRHRMIHSNDKPYRCNFCEKAFRRRDNLREHVNIHTQEHVYTCDRCGKKFPRKYTHKMHTAKFCNKDRLAESEEKETEVNWTTSENNMVTSDDGTIGGKPMMMKPTTTGHAKNSDPCRICNKTFRDTSTLKRHMLTHSDERPFKCRQCDKSFRRKDHLMEHIIVHNVARPFTCLQCGKSFSRKNGLKTHMMRSAHTDGHEAQVSILTQLGINNCGEQSDKDEPDFQVLLSQNDDGTIPQASHNQQAGNTDQDRSDEMTVEGSNQQPSLVPTNDNSVIHIDDVPEKNTPHIPVLHDDNSVEATLNENGVECPNCQNFFPGQEQLWLHFQEHLANDQLACEFCLNIFTTTEDMKDHQCMPYKSTNTNDVRSNELLELGISADMSSDGGKMEHQEDGDATKMLNIPCVKGQRTCEVCNKNFRDTTALKRHFLVHSGERPHACTRCDKRFRRRDHLKSHVTAYHCLTTTFQCKSCQMVFNTRYCLTTHIKSCQKSAPRLPSNSSENTKISGSLESRTCPLCNKVFKDPSSQRRHMRVHSDERPFQCGLCTKSFRRKDNLKEHMLCHSNQKPFACEDCGKTLSRRSSLTNHRTICTKRSLDIRTTMMEQNTADVSNSDSVSLSDQLAAEQLSSENQVSAEDVQSLPQQSTIDTNTLRDVQLLQTSQSLLTTEPLPPTTSLETIDAEAEMNQDVQHHDQTNIREAVSMMEGTRVDEMADDDNGYACNLCGKVFRAKWTLKYHQRVHTGEKPYTCETCDRHFRQPSHLKIHQRTHSGERPYVCDECGRAFIDSSTMRRHMRTHKADMTPSSEQGTNDDNLTNNLSESQSDMDTQSDQSASQKQDTIVTDQSDNTSIVHVVDEKTSEKNEPTNQSENTNIIHVVEQLSSNGEHVTNVQPGSTNIVHVVRELVSSGGNQRRGEEVVLTGEKLVTNIPGWQASNMDHVTYYIVPTENKSAEKQDNYENMSF